MAQHLLPPLLHGPAWHPHRLPHDFASCTRFGSLTAHLVHFSLGIWSTRSWGRGTKPQGGRNSAMLHSLPSCQTTALAVVDIGSDPYASACQRLVNCCQRMRMPLQINRFMIWEVKSDKTCAFLCHSCTASFPSQQVCNCSPNTVSSFFPLSFGRHFHLVLLRDAVKCGATLFLGIAGFECKVENVPMEIYLGAQLLWRICSQISSDSKSIKNVYRFWKQGFRGFLWYY